MILTKHWLLVLACVLALAVTGPVVSSQEGATPAAGATGIEGAISWLLANQGPDGGFVGFEGTSDPGATLDALVALAAARADGVDTGDSIESALAYLESGDVALVYIQTGAGQAAKLTLGLVAAGVDPSGFANLDPVSVVVNGADPATGIYGFGVFDHALAVMALVATDNNVPPPAIDSFAATQSENGGWAYDGSTDPGTVDTNTTAVAIQALVAAGEGDSKAVANGLAYLASALGDGASGAAFSAGPDPLPPDANSTALVAQALIATGNDPSMALAALDSFQNPSGAFFFNAEDTSDNLYATNGAIPALAGLPLPIVGAPAEAMPMASPVSWYVPSAA